MAFGKASKPSMVGATLPTTMRAPPAAAGSPAAAGAAAVPEAARAADAADVRW